MHKVPLLTGGKTDTRHRPVTSTGAENKLYNVPYATYGWDDVVALAQAPYGFPDKDSVWALMPCAYAGIDLREAKPDHSWQFHYLSADLDTGNYPKEQVVAAVRAALGPGVSFLVYSTFNAWVDKTDFETGELTNRGARWAVIAWLAQPVPLVAFAPLGKAFLDLLEKQGIKVDDRSSAQPKRLRFLPARHLDGQGAYDFHVEPGELLSLTGSHPLVEGSKAYIAQDELDEIARLARAAKYAEQGKDEGPMSRHAAYRRKHPTTIEMMEFLGFESIDGGRNWHHSSQGTRSYATELFPDGGLYTRSQTVGAMGGKYDGNGGWYFQDTYDIMQAVFYHGNKDHMRAYADQCLVEYPDQDFAEMVTHGTALWEGYWQAELGRAGERLASTNAAMDEALPPAPERVAESIPVPVDLVSASNDEMEPELYTGPALTDEWFEHLLSTPQLPSKVPPGLVGEAFRFARANTVTAALPEMLIPMSLSFVSTMALNAYYVERTGINNAYVVVADTAIGKSSSFGPFRELARHVSAGNIPDVLLNPPSEGGAVDHTNPEAVKSRKPGLGFIRGWPSHGNSYHKKLGKFPTMLAFVDEFGTKLLEAGAPGGGGITQTVVSFITEVITASGPTNALMAKDYTDDNKSVSEVYNPSFNFLGLMVPEQYEKVFTKESAGSGAANRRLVFEEKRRDGLPVAPGGQAQAPAPHIVQRFVDLINYAYKLHASHTPTAVGVDSIATAQYMRKFAQYVNYQNARRDREQEVRNMWARIYVHTLKVAATVAVGVNHLSPQITLEIFQWAQQLVAYSHGRVLWRLDQGAYNGNPGKDYAVAKECILAYVSMSRSTRESKANASGALLDHACRNVFRVTNIAALMRHKGVWESHVPKGASLRETADMLQLMADDELINEVSEAEMTLLGLKSTNRVAGNKVFMAKPVLLGL